MIYMSNLNRATRRKLSPLCVRREKTDNSERTVESWGRTASGLFSDRSVWCYHEVQFHPVRRSNVLLTR